MYYVYGDLTPFHDRWDKENGIHERLLGKTKWRIKAWWICKIHLMNHPHGACFVTKKEMPEIPPRTDRD